MTAPAAAVTPAVLGSAVVQERTATPKSLPIYRRQRYVRAGGDAWR